MTFQDYIKTNPNMAHCTKCDKTFENINCETEIETGDLIITVQCHGETHRERVTKAELDKLESKRADSMKPKTFKRRIVNIDPEIYRFSKFRRLK